MTNMNILIHSLEMCSGGSSDCCSECHVANLEDCSLHLMAEAAAALRNYYERDNEEDEDDNEPSDFDIEMGFDPYEGLYTFDC